MWHLPFPPSWTFVLRSHGLLFTFRRPSIRRIFGIQTLNHGCCLIPLSYSVSFTAIASLRAMSSLSSLSLSASFNRAYTFGLSSCCLTNLVTPPLFYSPRAYQVLHSRQPVAFVKNPRYHLPHVSHSTYPLALILSLFTHIFVVVFYIYVTNHSIQASQEFGP